MDFDLSLIDQVGVHKASSQPPRSSKFAPRAAARPKPVCLTHSTLVNFSTRQSWLRIIKKAQSCAFVPTEAPRKQPAKS